MDSVALKQLGEYHCRSASHERNASFGYHSKPVPSISIFGAVDKVMGGGAPFLPELGAATSLHKHTERQIDRY